MPILPFRVFGIVARCAALPSSQRPLLELCLVQSLFPVKYRPYWLGAPTLPLAFSSALWFFLTRAGRLLFRVTDRILSSSFTFL
jgi:hypothetical protein